MAAGYRVSRLGAVPPIEGPIPQSPNAQTSIPLIRCGGNPARSPMARGRRRPTFATNGDNDPASPTDTIGDEPTMTSSTSLLDWILSILRDPTARAAFQADPSGYANHNGFGNLSSSDVHDALCLIADNQSASYDHSGGNQVHYPPPHHPDHGGDAGRYLNNYISNNYTTIDKHDTNIDNSVRQNIDTHGGNFAQTIDNDPVVASGDHSVAAGGDIKDSTITSGNGNVVGDNNQAVTGNHNTTAFGTGDATNANLSGTHLGDGGALSVGGNASGTSTNNDTTTSVHNSGSGDTAVNAAGDHANASQYADQHQTDSSTHSNYQDNSDTSSHDNYNSNNDLRAQDSHNTDVHHA